MKEKCDLRAGRSASSGSSPCTDRGRGGNECFLAACNNLSASSSGLITSASTEADFDLPRRCSFVPLCFRGYWSRVASLKSRRTSGEKVMRGE